MCVCIYLFNVDGCENADSLNHKKMVSLLHVFACAFLNWNPLKMIIHKFHKKKVSLHFAFMMCIFRLELCKNTDPHTSQEYGFSLIYIHMWLFKLNVTENAYPHNSQEYGFSPLCLYVSI